MLVVVAVGAGKEEEAVGTVDIGDRGWLVRLAPNHKTLVNSIRTQSNYVTF
jgi:hypothetical protein